MLIKFFLCFVIFISSLQNSFAKNNLSEPETKLGHAKAASLVRRPPKDPPSVVYRADSRPLAAIIAAGGFRSWADLNDKVPNNNLAHHVEGASLKNATSNFISTFSTFREAVEHVVQTYYSLRDDFEPVYIYKIRPASNFFDVDTSLLEAFKATQFGSAEWDEFSMLSESAEYGEFVSHGTIAPDRIIEVSSAITKRLLDASGSLPNSPIFYENSDQYQWLANAEYKPAYDKDKPALKLFTNVNPSGMSGTFIANDIELFDIEPRFSCYGVGSKRSSSSKQVHILPACSARERLPLILTPYTHKMMMTILLPSTLF